MEAAASYLLKFVPLICIALSLVFFAAMLLTRRRIFSTCGNTFLAIALAWTAIFNYSKGNIAAAFCFAVFAAVWFYVTASGRHTGSNLR